MGAVTVGGPESRVEERELGCVQFSRTVCRQQTEIVRQRRRRHCRPRTRDVGSASAPRYITASAVVVYGMFLVNGKAKNATPAAPTSFKRSF